MVSPKEAFEWLSARMLEVIAGVFLLLFAGVWIGVAVALLTFDKTDDEPTLELSAAVVSTAGLLASTVGASTAAMLGIEIQKPQDNKGTQEKRAFTRVNKALKGSPLLVVGVLVYLGVGVANLLAWIAEPSTANDMIKAFGLGTLGWLAGGFSAVFRAEPNDNKTT